MTPDLDRIRTTHAAAIANRQRGSFDSRDDDIGALLQLVDELNDRCDILRTERDTAQDDAKREVQAEMAALRKEIARISRCEFTTEEWVGLLSDPCMRNTIRRIIQSIDSRCEVESL